MSNNQAVILNAVVDSDDVQASAATAWQAPTVAGPRPGRRQRPTLNELDDIERIAWDEGFAKGHAAGSAAAEQELKRRNDELLQRGQHFDAVLSAMSAPLQQFDEEMESLLVSLAMTIAKHIVRRELRLDPTQVIAVVREAVGLLPLAQRDVRVHLHPLDAALVRERLAEPQAERAWTLVEDPVMSRGGCRVNTDTAQIDARLEARLAIVVNHLLGDGRLIDGRSDELPGANSTDIAGNDTKVQP